MTKKEYLIKVLDQLETVRDLAPGLKIVVGQWAFWDDVLDVLIEIIESGIHSARSEISKMKMKKWLDTLMKMKQMEQQSALQDEQELKELDDLINNF